jgi:general secretion pathway protein F
VPILQALRVSGQTLQNEIYRQSVAGLQEPVRAGRPLSACLRTLPLFPRYACNLVAVGEEGGKMGEALLKIAATYERQAQREMKVAMSLLEPALILGIGLILGAVVVSIMLPIFEINTLIH